MGRNKAEVQKINAGYYLSPELVEHVKERAWERRISNSAYVTQLLERDKKTFEKKQDKLSAAA